MSNNSNDGNWGLIAFWIGISLPIYAAIKDYQMEEQFLAVLDILFFPLGIIRGIMYFFGG